MAGEESRSPATPAGPTPRPAPDEDDSGEYTIRPFRRADREAYLRLHETAFAAEMSPEWFAWKYERNPFVDHVPVTVAERDGRVVGAVSGFPLRMHTGSRRVTAYVSCEGFVHPEHRRRGVFTRMVRAAWDRHADEGMAFVFGLSGNEKTLAAHVKYNDWRPVAVIPRYYRFQHPGVLLKAETGSRVLGVAGRLSRPVVTGYLQARSRLGGTGADGITVERYEETPADLLASLYREHVPERVHAVRNERLFRWRFENPAREYTTYVASRDGSPVAAVVASTTTHQGVTTTRIMDALPMDHDRVEAELESLLRTVLGDHAHVVSALPETLPASLLAQYGFVRQDRFPLSRLTRPIHHGVRPLAGQDDDVAIDRLQDGSNWRLTYVEHDTN